MHPTTTHERTLQAVAGFPGLALALAGFGMQSRRLLLALPAYFRQLRSLAKVAHREHHGLTAPRCRLCAYTGKVLNHNSHKGLHIFVVTDPRKLPYPMHTYTFAELCPQKFVFPSCLPVEIFA